MSTSSLSTGAMEEQDHSVAEAVGGILEGISSKLPRANFTLDEDSDDEEDGGVAVFSRSQHLKALGLEDAAREGEMENGNNGAPVISEQRTSFERENVPLLAPGSKLKSASTAPKPREKSTSDDSGLEDTDWAKFKTDFAEKLRMSENKINHSEVPPEAVATSSATAIRQQLLIDAITTLHSSGRSYQADEGHKGHLGIDDSRPKHSLFAKQKDNDSRIGEVDKIDLTGSSAMSEHSTNQQKLPSQLSQKSLLSLDVFENIHESSLDHFLENVDNIVLDSATERNHNAEESSTSRSRGAAPPPPSKLAWSSASVDSGNETLMEELEHLSSTQSSKTTSAPSQLKANRPTTIEMSRPISCEQVGEDKPTIFLDLRPSTQCHDATGSGRKTATHALSKLGGKKEEGSSSESEDSDDPYSWISKRKQIKGSLEGQSLSSVSDGKRNDQRQQHNLHHSHRSINSGAQAIMAQNGQGNEQSGDSDTRAENGDTHIVNQNSLGKAQEVGVTRPHPPQKLNGQQVIGKAIIAGADTDRGTSAVNKINRHTKEREIVPNSIVLAPSNNVERQRSTDSFTFSSSPSEGEGPTSSEGTSCTSHSEDQRTSESSGKKGRPPKAPSSSGKGKTSSKKQSKKSKKSQKKDKGHGGQNSSADQQAKSKKMSKRRAYVLERIRSDSLTSSDEEHCLGSSEMSSSTDSGMSSLLHQDSILEDGDAAVVDVEKLKLHLQRRIFAKKPPTQFETPATQPVFHEDISFESELTCTKPGSSAEALLVLQVCEHGLIAPPEMFSEVDTSAKLGFHLLLLTWLFHATLSSEPKHLSNIDGSTVNENNIHSEQCLNASDLPFEIVAVQYTILDGNPSFLIGIKVNKYGEDSEGGEDGDLPRVQSGGLDTFFESETSRNNQLEAYFQQKPLSTLLETLANNETIQKLLSAATLEQLRAMLNSPLETVFTLQDDLSPLSTPVSFFWYSGYHPSCLPSNSSLKTRPSLATTVCTLGATSGRNVGLVFTILSHIYRCGLDLAGLRLVYGVGEGCTSIEDSLTCEDSDEKGSGKAQTAKFVVAIRGPDSVYHLMDIVGPRDESLAKVTDPNSLTALYGSLLTYDLHCLRTPYSASAALAKYFGGRACLKSGSILGISDANTRFERKKRQRVRFSESESAAEELPPSPLLDVSFSPLVTNRQRLLAEPYTKVVMIVSPHIPTSCYSTVLSCCSRIGFDIFGVKRLRLNSKRANALNIPPSFMVHFTPSSTPPSPVASEFLSHPLLSDHMQAVPPLPSCLMVLARENALLHTLALKAALISDLVSVLKHNLSIRESSNLLSLVEYVDSLVHVTEYSQDLVKFLGHFGIPSTVSSTQQKLGSGWDLQDPYQDELCFIAVPQNDSLTKATRLLDGVFCVTPSQNNDRLHDALVIKQQQQCGNQETQLSSNLEMKDLGGFELLGFKIIPDLPRFHTKQLCPVPVNDSQYQEAINILSDVPATLLLFRGIGCNRRLLDLSGSVETNKLSPLHTSALKQKLQVIVSSSFQDAYRLASIFFSDKELFGDLPRWTLSSFVPLSWHQDSDILHRLQRQQDEFCSIVTASACQMKTALKVMDKLSRSGCAFVGVASVVLPEEDVEEVIHLGTKGMNANSVSALSDPVIALCVQRVNAVWHVQHILKSFSETPLARSHLYCSSGFDSAIADVKQYFPSGLFGNLSSVLTDYQIKSEIEDNFAGLMLPEDSLPSLNSGPITYLSPLMEKNVMILPPSLVRREEENARLSTVGFVEVLDFLVNSAGFQLCGLKMVHLSLLIAGALHAICSSGSNPQTKVEEDLHSGPSLVLVVQRDNAIACCQMIIKSALQSTRGGGDYLNELMMKVIFPTDSRKAKQVFDLFQQNFR